MDMPILIGLAELVGTVLALGGGVVVVVLVIRSFRSAARRTSPDALRIVLDTSALAEQVEWEFTAMLRAGELTQSQYRTLIASLAEDNSLVRQPARSAGTDLLPSS